jgi:hypothetical protein
MSCYRIAVDGSETITDITRKPLKSGKGSSNGFRTLYGIRRGVRPDLCDGWLLPDTARWLQEVTARRAAFDWAGR